MLQQHATAEKVQQGDELVQAVLQLQHLQKGSCCYPESLAWLRPPQCHHNNM